ncbi:MAG: hypothetical protein IJP68_09950 [Selenomonadaceae bacterium]|nr:hypothetical protein [Selenomonadaceae bacterium]
MGRKDDVSKPRAVQTLWSIWRTTSSKKFYGKFISQGAENCNGRRKNLSRRKYLSRKFLEEITC